MTIQNIKMLFEKNNSASYFIIRLPDVLGTYDDTYRLWSYIEWIKLSHINPIEFETIDLVRPLSFVSKDDVCKLILKYLNDDKLRCIY